MNTLKIHHRHTGEVLYETEATSWKNIVEKAVKNSVRLDYADLSQKPLAKAVIPKARLVGADLRDASFSQAILNGAYITNADLCRCNFTGASLLKTDLRGSDITGASFNYTNIGRANIDEPICRIDIGHWTFCIHVEYTEMGCQTHRNIDILKWTPENMSHFYPSAKEGWVLCGETVKEAIRAVRKTAGIT